MDRLPVEHAASGRDPFEPTHPTLRMCDVQVRVSDYLGSWEFTDRWVDWARLSDDEGRQLEQLLAKAADQYRPTV